MSLAQAATGWFSHLARCLRLCASVHVLGVANVPLALSRRHTAGVGLLPRLLSRVWLAAAGRRHLRPGAGRCKVRLPSKQRMRLGIGPGSPGLVGCGALRGCRPVRACRAATRALLLSPRRAGRALM